MIQPFEAADDEIAAENPMSPLNGGEDDARLGGLLNSLSGQVSDAFSQLSKIHAEVCSAREAVERRDRERARELAVQRDALAAQQNALVAQQDSLTKERSEMDQLRASVAATSAELGRRADLTARMERELDDRNANLAREAQRIADLSDDLNRRAELQAARECELDDLSANLAREAQRIADLSDDVNRRAELLAARERAIDGFFSMLGRMQNAIVAPTVAEIEEAAAVVENPDPMPAVEAASDSVVSTPKETEQVDVANRAEGSSDSSTVHDEDGEPTPAVDLSDFTDDERATFAVRRRLRAYSDAFLAAEIRAERNGGKNGKKKRWF